MKKVMIKYSYVILLALTCVIAMGIWTVYTLAKKPASYDLGPMDLAGDPMDAPDEPEVTVPDVPFLPEKHTPHVKDEPEPVYVIGEAEDGYFEDALFVGDSRTVGLSEYGDLPGADFFAATSMTVFGVRSQSVSVPGVGTMRLGELLQSKTYGKIYVMLGINELGDSIDLIADSYADLLDEIQQAQPDAHIIIEAVMHVTAKRSNSDKGINNPRVDQLNALLKANADNEKIFYIDVNEVFDDGEGNLDSQYTFDHAHLLARYYTDWSDWLRENAVVLDPSSVVTTEAPAEEVE